MDTVYVCETVTGSRVAVCVGFKETVKGTNVRDEDRDADCDG